MRDRVTMEPERVGPCWTMSRRRGNEVGLSAGQCRWVSWFCIECAVLSWASVQWSERSVCDAVEFEFECDCSGHVVLDDLEFGDVACWKIEVERVAVVKFGLDQGCCNGAGSLKIERVTKVVGARAREQRSVGQEWGCCQSESWRFKHEKPVLRTVFGSMTSCGLLILVSCQGRPMTRYSVLESLMAEGWQTSRWKPMRGMWRRWLELVDQRTEIKRWGRNEDCVSSA